MKGETTRDLDYMHARYFSAHLGRFLSSDPIVASPGVPQAWNRYAYEGDTASVGLGVVGGASGSVTGGYTFHVTDPFRDGNWR